MKVIILTIIAGVLGAVSGTLAGNAVNSLIQYEKPVRGVVTLQNGTIGGLEVVNNYGFQETIDSSQLQGSNNE